MVVPTCHFGITSRLHRPHAFHSPIASVCSKQIFFRPAARRLFSLHRSPPRSVQRSGFVVPPWNLPWQHFIQHPQNTRYENARSKRRPLRARRRKNVRKLKHLGNRNKRSVIKRSGKRTTEAAMSGRQSIASRRVRKSAKRVMVKPSRKSKRVKRKCRIYSKKGPKHQRLKALRKKLRVRRNRIQLRLTQKGKINMEEKAAQRVEKMHLKKGSITQLFDSPKARLAWYRNIKQEAAQKLHQKSWGGRTRRALVKLEAAAGRPKKVLRQSMRHFIKRISPTTDVASLSPSQLSEQYRQLKAEMAEKLRIKNAELKRKKLEQLGKLPEEVRDFTANQFADWLETKKTEVELARGRRAAELDYRKGKLPFSPALASDRLIVLWYRFRDRNRRQI